MKYIREWIPPLLVLTLFILVWQLVVTLFNIPEYLIPAPSKIINVFYNNAYGVTKDTLITLSEAVGGFFIANILSIITAIGFTHFKWFEKSLYPYIIAIKSIPVVAIAPLLVLWFGYGYIGKVIMATIISFFPLVVNATIGLKSIDQEALDLMKSLSANRLEILVRLRFPNALPYIFSALKISSTLAVVGAIIAELTGAKQGIGFVILMSSYNIDTPMLFVAIILASLSGILFFGLIVLCESIINKKFGFTILKEGYDAKR